MNTSAASQTLMIQGTTSDAGKSTLVAALCRIYRQRGVAVAPFKPQNMALNSAVTPEGGEIGRAQAVQAQAAGLTPHVDMNPVLLKPNTDSGCQVIVHGKAAEHNLEAWGYHNYKPTVLPAVLESHRRLCQRYTHIVVEGAGSPAEINLRDNDIANMGFAEAVDCPVILIADIDKGGVFAHLVGTIELLSPSEQARVKGFIINRFRGDLSLLKPGLGWLEERTGKPVLGVLPYLHGLHLEAEDAISSHQPQSDLRDKLRVVVPVLPRISNHTDFDPLRHHPQVELIWAGAGTNLPAADLIILPGSKSVRDDLHWLREQGWENQINQHLRYGGKLLGICGGFQMLGNKLHDEDGVEGKSGSSCGLGLLEMETALEPKKQLKLMKGTLALDGAAVSGYEIHMGRCEGPALQSPFVCFDDNTDDGAISSDSQVAGTYLHGLFEQNSACQSLLRWAGLSDPQTLDYHALRDHEINRLAAAANTHLAINQILQITADHYSN